VSFGFFAVLLAVVFSLWLNPSTPKILQYTLALGFVLVPNHVRESGMEMM